MFIKNYTSEVPVHQTIFNIEKVLIKCGVSGIEKEYKPDGTVIGVIFRIDLEPGKPVRIRIPVKVEQALTAMWLDYVDGEKLSADGETLDYCPRKKKRREDFRQQAERTAWRIVEEWIQIQMSMIVMKQADHREVFLPYIWDGKRTFFSRLSDEGFKALLPERSSAE